VDRAGHHADQERDRPVSTTWIVISLVIFVLLYGTRTVDLLLMQVFTQAASDPGPRPGRRPVPAVRYPGA
jgi:hypothetical protein